LTFEFFKRQKKFWKKKLKNFSDVLKIQTSEKFLTFEKFKRQKNFWKKKLKNTFLTFQKFKRQKSF
jgi:hypothetical protein